MVKIVLLIGAFTIMLQRPLLSMEKPESEADNTHLSINYGDLSGLLHDGTLRRLSMNPLFLHEARIQEAYKVCLEKYRDPQELSQLMVASNKLDPLVASVFLKYGADPDHALHLIFLRAEKELLKHAGFDPYIKSWIVFLLMHGAQVLIQNRDYIDVIFGRGITADTAVRSIKQDFIISSLAARFNDYNSNAINIDEHRTGEKTKL